MVLCCSFSVSSFVERKYNVNNPPPPPPVTATHRMKNTLARSNVGGMWLGLGGGGEPGGRGREAGAPFNNTTMLPREITNTSFLHKQRKIRQKQTTKTTLKTRHKFTYTHTHTHTHSPTTSSHFPIKKQKQKQNKQTNKKRA